MPTAIMDRESASRVILEAAMARAEVLPFCGGEVAFFSLSAPAKVTPNEDAAALLPIDAARGVLAIADGAGGQRSGAHASRLAIETIRDTVERGADAGDDLRAAILDGIERANRAVAALGTGAATTVAVLQIDGATIRPFHVGDSMILVAGQRGRVKHQSLAHGPTGYAVEAGLLDVDEALHHAHRHVVSNFVGSADMRIEIGPALSLAQRDTVLLASDGLSDNLYLDEIVERVRRGRLELAAEELAATAQARMAAPTAKQPSHEDDLTFILFRSLPRKRGDDETLAESSPGRER